MEAVINKCPRFPPSEEVLLPQLHSWTSWTDLKTSQEPVKRYSGLVQAGSSNQTGHNLWEDAAKPDKWSGAAAFSMVSVGSAISSEYRLVNVNTNTFPSCLTPVSWGAIRDFKLPFLWRGVITEKEEAVFINSWHSPLCWESVLGRSRNRLGLQRNKSEAFRSVVAVPGFF